MKKKRIILSICACVCIVLSGIVVAIAFSHTTPKHEHVLSESKTYHICDDHIYYTRMCQDGCEVTFETKATLNDVISTVSEDDNIVLDEDVKLTEELVIKSFAGQGNSVQDLELNINLDLNNCTLSSDVADKQNNAMFMFNANRGEIAFNIKNGKITSKDLSYIFKFKNNKFVGDNIKINIEDVECTTVGVQSTPLFAHDCYNMEVNASNCKFISQNTNTYSGDYGVGAFINSDSKFNFDNCYFEGGDAVYVKSGTVNLTGCKLVNVGLVEHPSQSVDTFSAVGSCLAVDSHATSSGFSKFAITIVGCSMESKSSFKMIYVIETASESGLTLGIDENSIVDVQSCTFNNNPTAQTIPQYDIVKYPNNQAPSNNGTQVWVCGDITATMSE